MPSVVKTQHAIAHPDAKLPAEGPAAPKPSSPRAAGANRYRAPATHTAATAGPAMLEAVPAHLQEIVRHG